MLELDTIHHSDAFALMATLPDGSVDMVLTDPPYGMGIEAWDKPIDVDRFVPEVYRVLKDNCAIAFFHQMPYMVQWLSVFQKSSFRYKEHISWVKRIMTNPASPLTRGHESIFIYAKGKFEFQTTKGRYEDIRLAGLLNETYTIDGLDRYVKDLRAKVNGTSSIKKGGGNAHHPAHKWRGLMAGDRSPEFVNFTNVWSFLPAIHGDRSASYHATQKPLELVKRLIELTSQPDALIVDPFAGSGTTAIAARSCGRHYIVGDSSAEYVEVMRKRLALPYDVMLPGME